MAPRSRSAVELMARLRKWYGRRPARAEIAVEREVFGTDLGINSYTTVPQAAALGRLLGLRPGVRLLEVGSGEGWPGLHLAEQARCDIVLTDVPADAIRGAWARAAGRRLLPRCGFAVASGASLPFRPKTFDAVVHSDVL